MIRLLSAAILSGVCAFGQLAFVNSAVHSDTTGTNFTSLSTTASMALTVNNILVCGVRQDTDSTVPSSVTDGNGNNLTHLTLADAAVDSTDLLTAWWEKIPSTATVSPTANWTGVHSFVSIICMQFSGEDQSSPIDNNNLTATNNIAGTTTIASSSFTPNATVPDVCVIFVTSGSTTQTYTAGLIAGTNGTLITDTAGGSQMTAGEYRIMQTNPGASTAAMGGAANQGWELAGVTIKQAAAGGAVPMAAKRRKQERMSDE